MHELTHFPCGELKISDWWRITTSELEHIGLVALGPAPGGWVRRGDNAAQIAGKNGSDARKIEAELFSLTQETKRILGGARDDVGLQAAAFYHLRFENIHPLCEANGRIGRIILAGQLQQAYRISIKDTLMALYDARIDYHALFATNAASLMYELLVDLLSRITGIVRAPEALVLPARLEALHPQRGAAARPSQSVPRARNDYLRRFR